MAEPPDSPSFKAACIQMRSGIDRAINVMTACEMITNAARDGAQLIATPEMTNVVDRKPDRLLEHLPPEEELEEISTFSNLARDLNIWLVIGSMAMLAEATDPKQKRAFNRSYLFAPDGTIRAHYDKIHMFDVSLPHGETWRESAIYKPGREAVLAKTPLGTLGLSICYDLRFPDLYRTLALGGADIFFIPAAFTRQTGRAHWEALLRARAIESGAFVIAPAQGGDHEDGRETWGHSMIINPWGEIISQSMDDEPGIVFATINLSEVITTRRRIPSLISEHPPPLKKT